MANEHHDVHEFLSKLNKLGKSSGDFDGHYESSIDYDIYDDSCYSDSEFDDEDDDDEDYEYENEYMWKSCLVEDELLLQLQHLYNFNSAKKESEQNDTPVSIYSQEMAARNAKELVEEEEREKRKAEKRKVKKKRRREKKKEEKEQSACKRPEYTEDKQDSSSDKKSIKSSYKSSPDRPSLSSTEDVDDGEEFLDINSAFVSVAVSKKKRNIALPAINMEKSRSVSRKAQNSADQIIAESERLAVIGYKMASKEQYEQAVDYFTRAIHLVHDDHRFFSNRSFCHCQLGHFTKALKDAEKAVALAPNSPKGYFRLGEALKGLNQFKEAEDAFERVVQLDDECEDALQELESVKIHQLLEMGFGEKRAYLALQQYHSVQAAVGALTSAAQGSVQNTSFQGENEETNLYFSDDDVESHESSTLQQIQNQSQQSSSKANKMDPSNPEGHLSLWVGNVTQEVTEKQLIDLFSRFGVVLSVRLLPEKYCAFINFRDKAAPGPAMKSLQNLEVGGERLLIRYPNNPVSEAHQQIVIKKPTKTSASGSVQPKVTGPVNGDECHFWRTTGCAFGNKCRYKHVKENKGVDKKPWQKAA